MSKANDVTNAVVKMLNLKGFVAWRQNNGGVYDVKLGSFRKKGKSEMQGVSDIIGYCKKTGKFMAIEVKIGKDTLSVEQRMFLEDVNKAGGIGLVVKSTDDFLAQYEEILKHI